MSQEIAHTSQEQEEAMNMIEIVVIALKVVVMTDHHQIQIDLKETIVTIIIVQIMGDIVAETITTIAAVMSNVMKGLINAKKARLKEMENVVNLDFVIINEIGASVIEAAIITTEDVV